MPSKIPLSPGRGRVPTRTPAGTPKTSKVPSPGATTSTTKTTPKPSMIPRINNHSGVKAKTDSGLVRKKLVQTTVTVDKAPPPVVVVEEPAQEDLNLCLNVNTDIDVSSPIHQAVGSVDLNLNSRIPSVSSKTTASKIPGFTTKPLPATPSRNSEIESGSAPIRRSRNEILDMQLQQEMLNLEADKWKSAKSHTAPPQISEPLAESILNVDQKTSSKLEASDVGINVLMSATTLEDTLSKTHSPQNMPSVVGKLTSSGTVTNYEQQPNVEKAPPVLHVGARSGVDRFYDEQVLHELILTVDDTKENIESPVLPELPAVHGVSIQEITAPTQIHETISDPRLRDDPLVQLELEGAASICEEEQPACLVDSVTEIPIVSSPPAASLEELPTFCDNQQDKISIETFPISQETPTSSQKEINSCSSVRKSFSQILVEASSKTNQENLNELEKEMVSFIGDEAVQVGDANLEKESNGNEDEEEDVGKVSHQLVVEENYDSVNESSEFEHENDEEPKAIVEEMLLKESLQDTLSLSASNLRRELECLQTGVNEMQMWGSITMYLASGVIIGVLAMENLRGFMETSFAPPEPHTAVGFFTSMYRVVFGEPAK